MADTELTDLTEETDPTTTDILYLSDSGGTLDRKLALSNLLEYVPDLSAIAALATSDVVPIIDDPSGTPLQAKITTLNLVKAAMGLTSSEEFEIREVLHDETLASAGGFDVSSIPADYDDLWLYLWARSDVSAQIDTCDIFFNNDTTATNYHRQHHQVSNTTESIGEAADSLIATVSAATSVASAFTSTVIHIPEYANTSSLRIAFAFSSGQFTTGKNIEVNYIVVWEDGGTTAINRITLQTDNHSTDQFIAGSRLKIVGVKVSS